LHSEQTVAVPHIARSHRKRRGYPITTPSRR